MNIVDAVIIGIIAISVIYGFYHGFIQTIASVGAVVLAIGAAFLFGPKLAAVVSSNTGLAETFATYTDAVARVGDYDLASAPVAGISGSMVDTILASVKLPQPLADVLRKNLLSGAFAPQGLQTVNQYVSNTIVAAAVQVVCFLACFAVAYILLHIVLNLLQHVFRFPILKQLDWLAGGLFGLARGAVIVYLLLLLVPLVSTVVPTEGFDGLVQASSLAPHFRSDGFFVKVISGTL